MSTFVKTLPEPKTGVGSNLRYSLEEEEQDTETEGRIFLQNEEYSKSKFLEENKYSMMKILLHWYQKHKTVHIPKEIEKRSNEYLTYQYWPMRWFKENYKKSSDDDHDNQHLKLKEVYNELKASEEFNNQSYAEKRNLNYKEFLDIFRKNPLFGHCYVEKYQTGPKDERKCERNILMGYMRSEK